jgi:hypothetical protein
VQELMIKQPDLPQRFPAGLARIKEMMAQSKSG